MMRFTERDGRILQAIHTYDGILARRQIKRLFWPDSSWRVLHRRLAYLHYHQYIAKPNLEERKGRPIPEPVVWLNWRGALYVAGRYGIKVPVPKSNNENQLRKLERELRKEGMRWLREPRWSQLSHDLLVVDLRFHLEMAAKQNGRLILDAWVNESEFRSQLDVVEVELPDLRKRIKKGVCPDGSFVISDKEREQAGKAHRARFLLEVDMATHDNPSFGNNKAIPGAAYVQSEVYLKRFGSNAGRWLVVTTSPKRLNNLLRQIESKVVEHQDLFLFSTFDDFMKCDPLTDAIWWKAGTSGADGLWS